MGKNKGDAKLRPAATPPRKSGNRVGPRNTEFAVINMPVSRNGNAHDNQKREADDWDDPGVLFDELNHTSLQYSKATINRRHHCLIGDVRRLAIGPLIEGSKTFAESLPARTIGDRQNHELAGTASQRPPSKQAAPSR